MDWVGLVDDLTVESNQKQEERSTHTMQWSVCLLLFFLLSSSFFFVALKSAFSPTCVELTDLAAKRIVECDHCCCSATSGNAKAAASHQTRSETPKDQEKETTLFQCKTRLDKVEGGGRYARSHTPLDGRTVKWHRLATLPIRSIPRT